MSAGDLGDERLNQRRDRLIAALEEQPDTGFPDACADDAEVEALYRFLRNHRLSFEAVLEPHLRASRHRCAQQRAVLVLHDTTDMTFRGEAARHGLTRIGRERHSFSAHASLAVSADGCRTPLGLVALTPFVHRAQPRGVPKSDKARFRDPQKESRLWNQGVAAVRHPGITAVHVMDRGADSYELFADLLAHGDRFVIRLHHDRRVTTAHGPTALCAALAQAPTVCERLVTLAPRRAGRRPTPAQKRHPPRGGRSVRLRFAVERVALRRPHWVSVAAAPSTLALNVVYAVESDPPPGEPPVEWYLLTTEPVDTVAQILRVVDWYRTRWLIEEFFKALKTGCAYEKRQLTSWNTLLVALALLAPIAWQLLRLRHWATTDPAGSAMQALTAQQLQVLRASPVGEALPTHATTADALRAVARLGGHLRQNGSPGWAVLGRGMQKLLWMESGWAAAQRSPRRM